MGFWTIRSYFCGLTTVIRFTGRDGSFISVDDVDVCFRLPTVGRDVGVIHLSSGGGATATSDWSWGPIRHECSNIHRQVLVQSEQVVSTCFSVPSVTPSRIHEVIVYSGMSQA